MPHIEYTHTHTLRQILDKTNMSKLYATFCQGPSSRTETSFFNCHTNRIYVWAQRNSIHVYLHSVEDHDFTF